MSRDSSISANISTPRSITRANFGQYPRYPPGSLFNMLLEFLKIYRDIVLLEIPKNQYVYSIANPESIQHVLQMNNQNYSKGDRIRIVSPLIGNGLFASEGEYWRRHRF
jgi:cytochrome P450